MTEQRDTFRTLDLALQIGEILLSSGAGAADVTATMLAVTSACGVNRVTADVTYVDLALRHQPSADEPASIQVRRVTRRAVDYDQLIEVDRLVHDLVAGQVDLDQARDRVARLITRVHSRTPWVVTLAWGVMGVGVALTLGGSPVVCTLAFIAACAIDRTQRLMSRWQVPGFYQQVAGGLVATLIAMTAAATELHVNPSRVVTAGIVMLLAGIGLVGATQDAILGFPVTATARLMEALLATTGIIGGVSGGLALRGLFGVDVENYNPGAIGLAEAGVMVVGASLAAAAFGYASFAPGRALVAIALVAAIAQASLGGGRVHRSGQDVGRRSGRCCDRRRQPCRGRQDPRSTARDRGAIGGAAVARPGDLSRPGAARRGARRRRPTGHGSSDGGRAGSRRHPRPVPTAPDHP